MALFPISAQLIANTNITDNPTATDPSIFPIRNLLGEKLAYIHLRGSCRVGLPEQGALAFPTHPLSFDPFASICTPGREDGLLAKSRKANEEEMTSWKQMNHRTRSGTIVLESFGLNGWWITREFRYRCAGILAFYETRLTATCTTHKHTKITPTTALG